mgnify:FL=1
MPWSIIKFIICVNSMKKIVFFLSIVLCGQMCGNHIHNSRAGKIVDDKGSPSMEKVFISDRLQDSLEYLISNIDASDSIITISCFLKNKDTIIHIAACDYIYGFVDYESCLVYTVESSAGAFPSSGMIYALNYIGDFPLADIFDPLFMVKLDTLMYARLDGRCKDGYAIPYVMSLDVNEYGIRTIYTNITDRCHLNTLRGYTLVDN